LKDKLVLNEIIRWLPGLLISILATLFIVKIVDINVLFYSISEIGIKSILIIAVITIISLAARAVAWMKLLPKVNFIDSFLLINESYLFNNMIPRSGELVKTILFAKPASEHAFTIFSSVVVERSLDLVIAASMFLVTFPFVSQLNSIRPIAFTLLILFLLFLISGFLIALNAEKVKTWLRNIGKRNTNFMEKVLPRIEMVIDGFSILTNWRQFLSVLFWIIISWFLWTFIIFYGINTVHGGVKFWWAIFTEGVLALGIALPSAPAGLGVFEGTMIAALSVFDINTEEALGIAVVIHLVQIAITTIIGFIAVMRQGESISNILNKIRSTKQVNSKEIKHN
jgi:uncharacterized protein (TIRG00374 family)